MATRNGPTNGSSATIQWIAILASVFVGLASMFLTVANPREGERQVEERISENLRVTEARVMGRLGGVENRMQAQISERETLAEHKEYTRRLDMEVTRLAAEIDKLRADQVTRNEHLEHWKDIDLRISGLRELLLENQKQFAAFYNPGDQLKSLQDQIKELRNLISGKTANKDH